MALPRGGEPSAERARRVLLGVLPALLLAGSCVVELSSAEAVAPATAFPANEACACLSQGEVASRVLGPSGASSPSGFACPDGLLPASVAEGRFEGVQCLPPELGSGTCRAWDLVLSPVCEAHKRVSYYSRGKGAASGDRALLAPGEAAADPWCGHGWCYVDPAKCQAPYQPSTLFPEADLWYSYETCGYVDTYGPRLLTSSLEAIDRNAIRVSYPGNDAYRLWRGGAAETGSFVAVFEKARETLVRSAGGNLEFVDVPVSEEAKAFVQEEFHYSSSYTACAAMIAMNRTDICVGPFWSLPERHSMAQFIFSWEGDEVYLTSFITTPGGAILGGIFKPFTGRVWMLWGGCVVLTVLLFAWIEMAPRMAATLSAWRRSLGAYGGPSASCGAAASAGERVRSAIEMLLMSLEGVLDFHPEGYNPISNGGKLLKMAYIMFMIIFMATYTANLAAILGGQTKYEFESLEAAIAKGVGICVPEVLMSKLAMSHPGLEPLMVPSGFDEVMDAMDEGRCKAGLSYDALDKIRPARHCNKVAVGKPVSVLPVAMLSRPVFAQHLNVAVELEASMGVTDALTAEYIGIYNQEVNDSNGCSGAGGVQDDGQQADDRLNVTQMSGLFCLFLLAAGAALLLDTAERLLPRLMGRSRGLPFSVADRATGHCYLRDEYKDTYVVRMPPGLHYPDDAPSAPPVPGCSRNDLSSSSSSSNLAQPPAALGPDVVDVKVVPQAVAPPRRKSIPARLDSSSSIESTTALYR